MSRHKPNIILALGLLCLFPSIGESDSVELMPPLRERIVNSWVGICPVAPHGIYRLVINDDGTGRLLIHEGVKPQVWPITKWRLHGSQIYFTLGRCEDSASQLATAGVIPHLGRTITLRTRWPHSVNLPERTVLLLPEERVTKALREVGAVKTSAKQSAAIVPNGLIGTWISVRFGGRDIGENIQRMEYDFRANGSFRASARLKDKGDVTYEGTYSLEDGKVRMTIQGKGKRLMPFKIQSGLLRLRDQDIDSWVEYRKKPAEQDDSQNPVKR